MPPAQSGVEVCSGHPNLVPCRICTGFILRDELVRCLPEETHHSFAEISEWARGEKVRRDDLRVAYQAEMMALLKGKGSEEKAPATKKAGKKSPVSKKPAARGALAVVMKKPASRCDTRKPSEQRAGRPVKNTTRTA